MQIRCSSLARPMVCAGSLFFKDLPEQEFSAPAEEGTAAGELLEHYLTKKPTDVITMAAKNGVAFDSDMYFYVQPIASDILSRSASEVLCETRIDWQTRSGIWIRGQYDASYIGHEGALYIDDLKYGWGIVDVRDNWQLLGYAIGEVIRRQQAFEKIILRIHQPRPHHEEGTTRTWELTYEELLGYKERIEARMDQIAAGFRDLTTSEKCRYCPAAAVCPALNRAFYNSLDVSVGFMQDNIDETVLARQLDEVTRAEELIKVRKESLKALAVDRMKNGRVIPGYVSESSYGDRSWVKTVSPQMLEILTGKKVTEQVMLSPAKLEKLGIPKDVINTLVERRFLGQKLIKKDHNKLANDIFKTGSK